ncbi:MAG TPA: efflux RND transporter periplasmic adaptor subunit [Anaerolineaceae bacterium]
MKPMSKNKRRSASKIWIPIIILVLAAAGGFGYYYWKQSATPAEAASTSYNTTTVKKGSITISVSGSGTLIAGQEDNLAFSADGTVTKLNVSVGSVVKKGDVLAVQGNIDPLQAAINTAQQNVTSAQQTLDTLKQSAASNLATAQLAVATAQKAVDTARSNVVQKNWVRCDQTTLDAYYYKYVHAKAQLDALGDGGGNQNYYLTTIIPAKNIVAEAYAAYQYCAGYTNYEVSSSNANLSLAQAQLTTAQYTLDTLTKNNGIDPTALATAQNNVVNAQLTLETAKETLAGATITAPYDGTILAVTGKVGDSSGTGTFITIADLAHPQVQFSIDETDMDKVAVGETATVVFDALPNDAFTGKVTLINPSLSTANGYQVVTGLIELSLDSKTDTSKLLKNLTGTVQLVQASAKDVTIVSAQALHDLGDGSYSVFVVTNGQPTMKVVQVGLMDTATVEIKSGLNVGDVVTTGTVKTK